MGESGNRLFRRLLREQVAKGLPYGVEEGKHFQSVAREMGPSNIESGGTGSFCSDEYVGDNSTLLSLQPWVFRKGDSRDDGQQRVIRAVDDCACIVGDDDTDPPSSPTNYSIAYGSGRSHRNSIRSSAGSGSARKYSVKPINSLGNNVIPHQLCGDGFETEEFVFGPVASFSSSSIPCLRPFCITDGNQIINKAEYDPLDASPPNAFNMDLNIASSGGTSSSDGSPPEMKKFKRKSEEMQLGGLDASDSRGPCNNSTLSETHDRLLLFFMGIGIGVISSKLVNKKEVEQLNNLLKHNENLVQDLQEELDMKESLTVNELVNDSHEKQEIDYFHDMQDQVGANNKEGPAFLSAEHDITVINQSNSCKDAENLEYLNQIEAELEAELERLELNMFSSSLEGMTYAQDKHDPDLIPNAVHGELRADNKLNKNNDIKDEFHEDSGGILTPQKQLVDYSVSPRELSLRLHELKQLMLEERIKELEAKLHRTHKQLQLRESAKTDVLNSASDEGHHSSNHASLTIMEKGEDMSKPLCLNLSGDAPYAYEEEAYDELARVTAAEQPPSSKTNSCERVNSGDSFFSDGTSYWDLQDEMYPHFSYCDDKKPTRKHALNDGSNDESQSEEGEDGDEEGQMLIQQIVQRVRQDSSVALNAQRMLFFNG